LEEFEMVNRAFLIGRLGRDPELRYTTSGTPVASFSIATDERWVDSGGNRQTRTEWHNIVAWSKLAEICGQYLKKGKLVFIEGRIQTREWDDRDGNKRRTTEIVASNMQMLDRGGAPENAPVSQAPDQTKESAGQDSMEVGITDDDIPF
jgi:single-strand DNA-binding protein